MGDPSLAQRQGKIGLGRSAFGMVWNARLTITTGSGSPGRSVCVASTLPDLTSLQLHVGPIFTFEGSTGSRSGSGRSGYEHSKSNLRVIVGRIEIDVRWIRSSLLDIRVGRVLREVNFDRWVRWACSRKAQRPSFRVHHQSPDGDSSANAHRHTARSDGEMEIDLGLASAMVRGR